MQNTSATYLSQNQQALNEVGAFTSEELPDSLSNTPLAVRAVAVDATHRSILALVVVPLHYIVIMVVVRGDPWKFLVLGDWLRVKAGYDMVPVHEHTCILPAVPQDKKKKKQHKKRIFECTHVRVRI